MFAIRRSLPVAFSLIASLLGACGGDAVAPNGPKPGLTLLPYADLVDTVGARPTAPLVAEYRSADGTPMSGVDIRFEAPDVKWNGFNFGPVLFVSSLAGSTGYMSDITVKTDAAGHAEVPIAFGMITGSGTVRVSAPTLGGVQTMSFTATVGKLARVLFSVGDTVISIGGSVSVAGTAVDRFGNQRADAVTLRLRRGGTSASLVNGTLTGIAFGQAVIESASPVTSDSLMMGVVPPARFAVVESPDNGATATKLYLMNSDLTGRRLLDGASPPGDYSERVPVWSPTGGRLAVQMGAYRSRLFFVDTTTGAATRAIPDATPTVDERLPAYSRDGQWLYYSATPTSQDQELWRARADGSQAERIGLPADWYDVDSSPSVSPDGTRLVYYSNRPFRSNSRPMVMTLRIATTDTTDIDVEGIHPRWSPAGLEIAYQHEDTLKLVRADGTNQRVLGLPKGYNGFPAWSPDGKYLIVSHERGLQMIRVASGEIVFYPASTTRLWQPAWRP